MNVLAQSADSAARKMLVDRFNRVHDYLRISVTDRCNLRCVYCMPPEGMEFAPAENILSDREIVEVVRVVAGMGVTKLRITGGEPLVRKGLPDLIAKLAAIPGIADISMTTNGIYLAKKAKALKAAGLNRVNISLDSLKPERFAKITRGGDLQKVLDGIEACRKEGIAPIKLNVVLMKGENDDEIVDFLRMTRERPVHVRFIEYMPIGHQNDHWRKAYLPLTAVLDACSRSGMHAERVEKGPIGNGPAEVYRIAGAAGTFGLIHPVSDHFCGSCTRLRLTADGNVKPCLYWNDEFNVRKRIGDDEAVRNLFLQAIGAKPYNHEMAKALNNEKQSHTPTVRRMSQIGG
ncbi:MAG TPA: GTP 3',8-cyclase MoaA [Bacilli bacterium]